MAVELRDLFNNFPFEVLSPIGEAQVSGVTSDSREVVPGSLFVALRGESFDGHRFIAQAVERGATAVVGMASGLALPVPYVQVEDSRKALPHLAAAVHGFPARRLVVIGVTGTDGKTTTTNMIFRIMLAAGLKAGMISTVNAVIGNQVLDTGFHVTTPDAPQVQHYLAQMVAAGLTHVVLETTSHGLAQFRVDACEFDLAIVTNITHEHLDYHGGYEMYRAAKARLFQMLEQTRAKPQGIARTAILNRDDVSYNYLSELVRGMQAVREVRYGLEGASSMISLPGQAEVFAEKIFQDRDGTRFEAVFQGQRFPIRCKLVGLFNVSNCLAAIAATVAGLGLSPEAAQRGIAGLEGVPGRMERIDLGQDFTAIVDFAHTPNALRKALETCRQLTQGKVIAVFGSAGLRDRQKRRMMAEVAAELADQTVLTAEDPRTESLDDILAEMADGATAGGGQEGDNFWRVPDRGQALRMAVSLALPGDLVIACGKGHEQSMCFGTIEYAWDDRTALRAALAEHLGIEGPAMPGLPTSE